MDPELKVVVVPVTPFQQNCSLLWCQQTGKGAAIDPGGDIEQIVAAAQEHGIEIERLLITHGHIDHAGGAAALAERLGVPIEGPHESDRFLIENISKQGAQFGLAGAIAFEPERWLEAGDRVTVGEIELDVLHCPGHTPGHVVYFAAQAELAFVGDVLFNGSVGRTDLPGGDHATLISSIREKLWPLGNEVTFISGHGPASTFGAERQSNAFVSDFVQY